MIVTAVLPGGHTLLVRRLTVVALAVTIGASSPAGAAGGKPVEPILFGTRGSILRIAADGTRVALATTGIARQCDRIVVWNEARRSFTRFRTGVHCPGGESSGGQGLAGVALAGTRVAWLERAAGNLEDLTIRTAAVTGPKVSDVAFAENQNGAGGGSDGDYLGNLFGGGTLIAYNSWSVCTILPPGWQDDLARLCPGPQPAVTDETHVPTAQRLWTLVRGHKAPVAAGAGTYPVVAVDANRIAAQQASGTVDLYAASGALLKTIAVPPGAFAGTALQGNELATLRSGALEVYDVTSGARTKTIPVAGKAVLRGLQNGLAVWVRGRQVHVVRLSDGKSVTITAPGAGPVDAQLEPPGLYYSYNLPKSTARGRVAFVPLARLEQRF